MNFIFFEIFMMHIFLIFIFIFVIRSWENIVYLSSFTTEIGISGVSVITFSKRGIKSGVYLIYVEIGKIILCVFCCFIFFLFFLFEIIWGFTLLF